MRTAGRFQMDYTIVGHRRFSHFDDAIAEASFRGGWGAVAPPRKKKKKKKRKKKRKKRKKEKKREKERREL